MHGGGDVRMETGDGGNAMMTTKTDGDDECAGVPTFLTPLRLTPLSRSTTLHHEDATTTVNSMTRTTTHGNTTDDAIPTGDTDDNATKTLTAPIDDTFDSHDEMITTDVVTTRPCTQAASGMRTLGATRRRRTVRRWNNAYPPM